MNEWRPISEPPKVDGAYLCQELILDMKSMSVLNYSTDLYKIDDYDFYDCKGIGGFYSYGGDYGYHVENNIQAWMELPPEYNGD